MSRVITRKFTEHSENENNLNETLFSNANGYIGVRGSLEEGVADGWNTMRGTYLNGVYDVIPMKQAEQLCNFVDKKDTMVNVPDLMTVNLLIDKERFNLNEGTLVSHTRTLDMDKGYTLREVDWISPKGHHVIITSKRLASFKMLNLFSIEYSIKLVEGEANCELTSSHIAKVTNYCNPNDPRLASESIRNLDTVELDFKDGVSYSVSETSVSKLKICALSNNTLCVKRSGGETNSAPSYIKNEASEKIDTKFFFDLKAGEEAILTKMVIYTDSIREKDPLEAAFDYLVKVKTYGLEYFYTCQSEILDEFWKNAGMQIYGDDDVNNAVAFNMFELFQSVAKDKYCSIAAKGLSGEGYEGHYFWDTEVFVLPFFILTNPELARMILKYRYNTLDCARENAGLLGHKKGALFPWRTIAGKECSGYYVSGSAAYHINADIAYAVVSYYLTSGDIDFIERFGEEILIETARLWMDLGLYNRDGKFVLNDVTGPDEYTCMVNNNYYTNCAAKYNLLWAVTLYERLAEEGRADRVRDKLNITLDELTKMKKASDNMLLLYDEKLGINPQDDSFLDKPVWDFENTPKENYPLLLHYHPLHLYRHQVCKQADTVMAYYMFEEMQSADVMRRSYDYYEKITTHDSSLSTCAFSITASRLGMHDKGVAYFGDSSKLDLMNTHNNTKDGIHTANMGGCYMAIVNGFAGLRIRDDGVFLAPFIPSNWDGYKFNIVYKDNLISIEVTEAGVVLELLEGENVDINVYNRRYELSEMKNSVKIPLNNDACAVIA